MYDVGVSTSNSNCYGTSSNTIHGHCNISKQTVVTAAEYANVCVQVFFLCAFVNTYCTCHLSQA